MCGCSLHSLTFYQVSLGIATGFVLLKQRAKAVTFCHISMIPHDNAQICALFDKGEPVWHAVVNKKVHVALRDVELELDFPSETIGTYPLTYLDFVLHALVMQDQQSKQTDFVVMQNLYNPHNDRSNIPEVGYHQSCLTRKFEELRIQYAEFGENDNAAQHLSKLSNLPDVMNLSTALHLALNVVV